MNFKSFFKHQVKRIYLEDMTLDWMDLVGVSGGAALFTPWPAGTSTGRGWSSTLSLRSVIIMHKVINAYNILLTSEVP